MKRMFLLLAVVFSAQRVFALGLSDFDISAEAKLQDKDRSKVHATVKTTEQWVYNAQIFNRSSTDFGDLEVRYEIFVKEARIGGKVGGTSIMKGNASVKVPGLKAHTKFAFETKQVEIFKRQLEGGWVYVGGARPRNNDQLEGIWFRVFKDGVQIAESTVPAGLDNRVKWTEQAGRVK